MIITIVHKLLILLLLLVMPLSASQASDLVQRVFGERDGLVNATVNDIEFDDYGYTWVATEEGLYRVSNSRVRRIDMVGMDSRISDGHVYTIRRLSAEHLLLANFAHVYLYDIVNDQFLQFGSQSLLPEHKPRSLAGISHRQGDNWLLLFEDGELAEFSYAKLSLTSINYLPVLPDQPWNQLQSLPQGKILVSNGHQVQLRGAKGELEAVLPWQDSMGVIRSIYQDKQGKIWFTSSDGLYQLSLTELGFSPVKSLPYYISRMTEDSQGNYWLASRKGLIKWQPSTNVVTIFSDELKNIADIDYIYDIAIDGNNVIWVGGSGESLAVITDRPEFLLERFSNSKPYQLSDEMIWSIFATDNHLWFGTDNGLIRVEQGVPGSLTIIPEGIALNDSIYRIAQLDEAHLLLSTTNGLFTVNINTFESQRFASWTDGNTSLEHKVVYTSYRDPTMPERWWFATAGGLFYWDRGTKNVQAFPLASEQQQFERPDIRNVHRSADGKLWLAGAAIFGFIGDDGKLQSRFDIFSEPDRLVDVNYIESIGENKLWVGASTGLMEYDIASGESLSLTDSWQVDCGSVYFIQPTTDYRLIGCLNSIIRQQIATDDILVLEEEDGLFGDELNDGAYFYEPSQGLYVGTPDGVMLIAPDKLNNRLSHDGVFLEAVSVLYPDNNEMHLVPQPNLVVKPNASMISFQLTSMDYLDDQPLVIKYRLREQNGEFDKEYVMLSGQSQINISELNAGGYVLEALSQQNGIWAQEPYVFPFKVEQIWWKTTWFKALLVFGSLLICIGIIIARQRQLSAFIKVNRALVESEVRLRQSLKGSDSELWEWRSDSQLFTLENQTEHFTSTPGNIKLDVENLPIHPEDKAHVYAAWQRLLTKVDAKFDVEYRYRKPDKTWGWTRVRGRPIVVDSSSGEVLKVAGIYADITAKRKLEDDAKLLAQAFGNTSEGVLILDANEQVKVSNQAAQLILGFTESALLELSFSQLVNDGEGQSDEVATLLNQGVSWTGEREFICADKHACPVWLNLSTMLDQKGNITHYVAVFSDITERKRTEADLRRLANYDVLTGLTNRSLFSSRLTQAIHRAERNGEKLALLFLDLDRFKNVNDSYGHSMGDALLVEAANRLQSCVDDGHTLCRFGGDEFVILLHDVDSVDEINHLCEQLLQQIEKPFELYGREFYISTSIGVSLWPDDARQPETLIKNADQAMYHAKEEGRGNFQYFSSERNSEALYHLKLEADLRKAIERNEFELHYQPQIDIIKDDKVIGMEALLRWRHPQEGYIRPDIFIKVAESCGLIIDIDRWVLQEACQQAAKWQSGLMTDFCISINISAVQFRQPDFIQGVKRVLADTGLSPKLLSFEITEGVLMKELQIAQSHLKDLREIGIEVAIDDFGTGYSSLAYLRHFDVNTLKIDRSFLIDIATNEADQAIASSIIELARNLKLTVVAEGVETQEQLEQVFSRGCYIIQGYYFSKPLPAKAFEDYINQQSK
ncbi:EAL domain-containing protein [Shewanella sp. Scap07]|uniref:EAL domain-containing protein n=1 Tax=Shewanella sp. Scap07 TaxID=2589987 RepID=UPI0015BAD781|nr:EAL domain-containing protein [Shewanella sp. Scap07]QLE87200.1 EAL domain-containing protein [Shewanella sp. Scap07]